MRPDRLALAGSVRWTLTEDGRLIATGEAPNLVTQVGDQLYAERGAGISSPPSLPTGMRLGTGSTTPAKTGAGAAVVTYVSGSSVAFTGGYPTSSLVGSSRRIIYQTVWGAGVATADGIFEVVLTNQTPLTNTAGTSANTVARALLRVSVDKGAGQILTMNWQHDALGG